MRLDELPVELLREIFIQLRDDAPSNLLPTAQVTRQFYMILMPLIYECIRLDISLYTFTQSLYFAPQKSRPLPLDTLVARLSSSPSIRAFVRQIRVFKRGVAHPDALDLLLSLIPEFSQLTSFTWDDDCQIPTTALNIFSQHWPRAQLQIRTMSLVGNISRDWQMFRQAPNMLRSLQICIPSARTNHYGSVHHEAKRKLFWVLNNCPGLQCLSTYSDQDFSCGLHDGPRGSWHKVKFGGPLPQLLELSITDRTFSVSDLLQWGRGNGWLKLKKITLWESGLLSGLRGCEQSLRSIQLIGTKEGYENDLMEICSRTRRMTELKINAPRFRYPTSTLAICGASLVTLAVHCPREIPRAPPLDFLEAIQRHCPLLVNLALDARFSSIVYRTNSKEYTSTLSQMPQLKELTFKIAFESSLKEVKNIFGQIVDRGGSNQRLNSLTLHESPESSEWDNPWGTVRDSSRVFQATRGTNVGIHQGARRSARLPENSAFKILARQTHGPPPEWTIQDPYLEEDDLPAEKTIEEHLDAIPPTILSQLIKAGESQLPGPSSNRQDHSYPTRTGGWNDKLADYEAKWKEDGGLLALLESQLQKRKERGWKLWDMPLMESEAGKEGFLYDRIMKAGAGN
ncbi:hypothetical protein BDR22DRAFT_893663 [Usnea florida]